MAKIQIKTRLHDGIYKSQGGGQTRIVAEWNYGPRNLVKAYRFLLERRDNNIKWYGNIGCGHTWLSVDDGRSLDDILVFEDNDTSHDDLVKQIESALMTQEQHSEFYAFVDAQMDR